MDKTVEVNGQIIGWEERLTVTGLLEKSDVGYKMFIVKVNEKIVPKDQYGIKIISEGSQVRIVPLLPGG